MKGGFIVAKNNLGTEFLVVRDGASVWVTDKAQASFFESNSGIMMAPEWVKLVLDEAPGPQPSAQAPVEPQPQPEPQPDKPQPFRRGRGLYGLGLLEGAESPVEPKPPPIGLGFSEVVEGSSVDAFNTLAYPPLVVTVPPVITEETEVVFVEPGAPKPDVMPVSFKEDLKSVVTLNEDGKPVPSWALPPIKYDSPMPSPRPNQPPMGIDLPSPMHVPVNHPSVFDDPGEIDDGEEEVTLHPSKRLEIANECCHSWKVTCYMDPPSVSGGGRLNVQCVKCEARGNVYSVSKDEATVAMINWPHSYAWPDGSRVRNVFVFSKFED